ncbi:MAG: (2Fe-2S)-binding protein [Phycisphaerales bacterium]|nr:(2Fe-2S)-binding protein [Phycisphaerales bacterium]
MEQPTVENTSPTESTVPPSNPPDAASDRRTFLKKIAALVVGGIAVMVPLGAGLATFLNPLRKRIGSGGAAEFIKVTTLEALKDDGLPHRFAVVADKSNIWMTEKNVAVGSVYLKRKGDQVVAWNTVCPHLGCQVDVVAGGSFKCPCHNSIFKPDGSVTAGSVSPRGMDELDVDTAALKDGEVRVRYQNFIASIAEKKPSS